MSKKSLVGKWDNTYGSQLTIKSQTTEGVLIGSYASSTGSTGLYNVVGWTQETAANGNQSIAIAIYWKSITGGTPDPSWHWVSMMTGNVYYDTGGKPTIEFLHAMTTSEVFPAVDVVIPGRYGETLTFTPSSNVLDDLVTPDREAIPGNPIVAKWQNAFFEEPNQFISSLDISTLYDTGMLIGELNYNVDGESLTAEVYGMTDIDYFDVKDGLLTVSLTANIKRESNLLGTISLAGQLGTEQSPNELRLLTYFATPPTYKNKFTGVNVHEVSFNRTS